MGTQKEAIENLINVLKKWQKVEDSSIKNSTEILSKTDNPLVHLVMEIIRQDSAMHRRVQQLVIDHFTKNPINMSHEDMSSFWEMVEQHDEIEKTTISLAKTALEETKSPIAKYLLEYLLIDEEKHDRLLDEMNKIKLGMVPYGGY